MSVHVFGSWVGVSGELVEKARWSTGEILSAQSAPYPVIRHKCVNAL